MLKDDRIRIQHMLDAIDEALSFIEGRSKKDLFEDRMLTLSIIKEIEIIGEAASRVTDETQREYPGIPWNDIVGMRNRLIHVYFDIDIEIVWNTIVNDLPDLKAKLEKIMKK